MRDTEPWVASAEQADERRQDVPGRASIEQARGVILILLATDADQAFSRLMRASTDHNVDLAALARAIVDLCTTPSPIFAQAARSTNAHVIAFDLVTGWGMDFEHRPTTGMDRRFAPTQRAPGSVRPPAGCPSPEHID